MRLTQITRLALQSGENAIAKSFRQARSRAHTTLAKQPYLHVFPTEKLFPSSQPRPEYIITLLSTSKPCSKLAVGYCTQIPPTPSTFRENPTIIPILNSVLSEYASQDPSTISQAQAFASTAGSSLGAGGIFSPHNGQQSPQRRRREGQIVRGGTGVDGGASSQGGAGGGGRGGHIHVYDQRHPPDYGRIPDPEDIFGSLEVDASGCFVDGHGNFQDTGTYRMITLDGILGLTPFLREKFVERLKQEEAAINEADNTKQ